MLEQLMLVRGAIAKKDIIPVLTHFHIYDGQIQGGNGRISIDCPCPDLNGFEFTVPAERFLKAIDACNSEPKLKITDAGKLSITKGKFRALLPLDTDHENFPKVDNPKGLIESNWAEAFNAMRLLLPLIADDAVRTWSNGIWFNDGYAYATNNIVLARTKLNVEFKHSFILPIYAIEEILRIGMAPIAHKLDATSLYLKYKNGMWLRSLLLNDAWPESVPSMIQEKPTTEIPAGFVEAVNKIIPFCPEKDFPRIGLNDGIISTDDGVMSAEVGGFKNMQGFFRAEPLLCVARVATSIDFNSYPNPCFFKGDNIEGVLVGVKK